MLLPKADILRTRYLRLPGWLKTALLPALSLIPMTARYGQAYADLRRQLALSAAEPELAREMQLKCLRSVIESVQRRSPFYRQRLIETFGGPVDPASFGLADLARVPITTREEVALRPESLLVVDRAEADLRQTSGSNGRPPLKIYLDR